MVVTNDLHVGANFLPFSAENGIFLKHQSKKCSPVFPMGEIFGRAFRSLCSSLSLFRARIGFLTFPSRLFTFPELLFLSRARFAFRSGSSKVRTLGDRTTEPPTELPDAWI